MIYAQTTTWTKRTVDGYQSPVDGESKTIKCRVEASKRQIVTAEGKTVQAKAHFWFTEDVSLNDTLTYNGEALSVLQVGDIPDLSGKTVGREAWC